MQGFYGFLVLFLVISPIAMQRPSYAANRPPGPSVLPQYEESSAASAAAAALGDRFGADNINSNSLAGAAPVPTTARPLTAEEQRVKGVYPSVEDELIRQISQWPREKQPFWYLNAAHIQSHRGQGGGPGLAPPATANNPPARSPFQRNK